MTEAEIGVTQPQAKDAKKDARKDPSLPPQLGPPNTLSSDSGGGRGLFLGCYCEAAAPRGAL